MRAQYALTLSRLFGLINARQTTDDIRMMYSFIYPQIFVATRKGLMKTMISTPMNSRMVNMLVKDGFLVTASDDKVYVDWGKPWPPDPKAPDMEPLPIS
jgi:hypothetical protein